MKVYLAGKISKNDWRHELVAGSQPRAVDSMQDWEQVSSLPMITGDTYVGPFFISCDHGCSHSGEGAHGAGQGCSGFDSDPGSHRTHVREKAMIGIKACDLFIAYLGLDFNSAYGTMAEIGAAHVQGKKIVLIVHPALDMKDFWFLTTMANRSVVSDNPAKAASELLTHPVCVPVRKKEFLKSVGPKAVVPNALMLTDSDKKFLESAGVAWTEESPRDKR